MSWKGNVVIGATVLGLVVGVNEMLSVKTPDDYKRYHQQQLIEQGADAVEMENERARDQLPDSIDAENSRKLTSRAERPAEPKLLRLRIRP